MQMTFVFWFTCVVEEEEMRLSRNSKKQIKLFCKRVFAPYIETEDDEEKLLWFLRFFVLWSSMNHSCLI